MGKYRDHRERRGKRHGNDQDAFFGQASEPSYFQDAPRIESDAIDAELLWFSASKGFGFVKLSDGAEAYLHIRVLEAVGLSDLSDGTHLKVIVEEAPRGARSSSWSTSGTIPRKRRRPKASSTKEPR
jgi:CspA family cold shock protein